MALDWTFSSLFRWILRLDRGPTLA